MLLGNDCVVVDGKTLSDARFLQFSYGDKANGLKITLKRKLDDPALLVSYSLISTEPSGFTKVLGCTNFHFGS